MWHQKKKNFFSIDFHAVEGINESMHHKEAFHFFSFIDFGLQSPSNIDKIRNGIQTEKIKSEMVRNDKPKAPCNRTLSHINS